MVESKQKVMYFIECKHDTKSKWELEYDSYTYSGKPPTLAQIKRSLLDLEEVALEDAKWNVTRLQRGSSMTIDRYITARAAHAKVDEFFSDEEAAVVVDPAKVYPKYRIVKRTYTDEVIS